MVRRTQRSGSWESQKTNAWGMTFQPHSDPSVKSKKTGGNRKRYRSSGLTDYKL